MTWWQALLLGMIEGLTEFLPVSSTGHLILTQRLMGIAQSAQADAYVVVIQFGAIVAVLGLYRRRAWQMLRGLAGRDAAGLSIALNMMIAFVPAAIIGLVFDKKIEQYLFGLWPITLAWLVGGVAILGVVWWRRKRQAISGEPVELAQRDPAADLSKEPLGPGRTLETMSWKMAMLIGFAQCIAMWPGTSRSMVTIVAGVVVGLELAAAVEFSFILGVVTLAAATLYKTWQGGEQMLHAYDKLSLMLGLFAAAIAAAVAVKWMVTYLHRHSLAIFGWYRIALALAVALLLALHLVQAT
jgi:undecaprenyl-diphosphatase